MRKLILCSSCSRHVAAAEPACPFCGQLISEAMRQTPGPLQPPRGMSRAQMYAFKMAMLASGAAALSCNDPKAADTATSATASASVAPSASASTAAADSSADAASSADTGATASASAAAASSADAVASAEASATQKAVVKPAPPPPVQTVKTVPKRDWKRFPPPKPYGCVWPDPEADDEPPVSV